MSNPVISVSESELVVEVEVIGAVEVLLSILLILQLIEPTPDLASLRDLA